MVDNRSAGVFGVGGSFNFKSGDPSGTAAKTSDEKMGQGSEYFMLQSGEEEQTRFNEPFVDRSAQLSATLNSLAMANVAGILKNITKSPSGKKIVENNDDSSDIEFQSEDEKNKIKPIDESDKNPTL